jgi:hypothetical protein
VTIVGLAGQALTNQVYDIASILLTDQQIYSQHGSQCSARISMTRGNHEQKKYTISHP